MTDPLQAASPHDGLDEPVPGFVVGGPNRYSDSFDVPLNEYIERHNPAPAKTYLDYHGSYSSNETAVNYTAPLVFLGGYFYNP